MATKRHVKLILCHCFSDYSGQDFQCRGSKGGKMILDVTMKFTFLPIQANMRNADHVYIASKNFKRCLMDVLFSVGFNEHDGGSLSASKRRDLFIWRKVYK